MTERYYRIKQDIFDNYRIREEPPAPSFIRGVPITQPPATPILSRSNNLTDHPPAHLCGRSIPLMSRRLLTLLTELGVDNLDTYDAIIENPSSGDRWTDHVAFNVIGLYACADMASSQTTELVGGSDTMPALSDFQDLVLDEARLPDLLLFRLGESPSTLLVHERVLDAMEAVMDLEDWRVSIFEVPVTPG